MAWALLLTTVRGVPCTSALRTASEARHTLRAAPHFDSSRS